jgi:hypothetical protein
MSNDQDWRQIGGFGKRSPAPCLSLSVTLVIGIISRPTIDQPRSDTLELARDMRQMRTVLARATTNNIQAGRLRGGEPAFSCCGQRYSRFDNRALPAWYYSPGLLHEGLLSVG